MWFLTTFRNFLSFMVHYWNISAAKNNAPAYRITLLYLKIVNYYTRFKFSHLKHNGLSISYSANRYSPDRNRKPNQRSFGIYELLTMISILYRHHSSLFLLLMILYFSTLLLPFGKAFTLTVLVTINIVYLCFLANRVSFSIIRCPR